MASTDMERWHCKKCKQFKTLNATNFKKTREGFAQGCRSCSERTAKLRLEKNSKETRECVENEDKENEGLPEEARYQS